MESLTNEQILKIVENLREEYQVLFKKGPKYFNRVTHFIAFKSTAKKLFSITMDTDNARRIIEEYFAKNHVDSDENDEEEAYKIPQSTSPTLLVEQSEEDEKQSEVATKQTKAKSKSKAKAKVAKTSPKRVSTAVKEPSAPRAITAQRKILPKIDNIEDYKFNEDGFLEKFSTKLDEDQEFEVPDVDETVGASNLTAKDLIKLIPESEIKGVNVTEYLEKYDSYIEAINEFKKNNVIYPKNGKLFSKKVGSKLELTYHTTEDCKKSTPVTDEAFIEAYTEWSEYLKSLDLKSSNRKVLFETAIKILSSPIMHTPYILSPDVAVKIGLVNSDFCFTKFNIPSSEFNNREIELELIREFTDNIKHDAMVAFTLKQKGGVVSSYSSYASHVKTIWNYREGVVYSKELTEDIKLKCWYAAKLNIENIKDSSVPRAIVQAWENILSSPFCYYVFMYGIEENEFISSALEQLFKVSVKLFAEELYPISFLTTVFMFGSANSGSTKIVKDYFNNLIIDSSSNWIYYLINHESESYNKTLSIVEGKKDKLNKN